MNFFTLKSAILGLILGVFWLIWGSIALGKVFLAKEAKNYQLAVGLFLMMTLIILVSAIFFYTVGLSELIVFITFILISVGMWLAGVSENGRLDFELDRLKVWKIIYLILVGVGFWFLAKSATDEAIRSPWEVVPSIFFAIYFLASLVLVRILIKDKENKGGLILVAIHFLLSLGVGLIVYKIGFGFDAFVHRAAENKLAEIGYILPKPFYYLGQYSLVVFLSKILWVKIEWIDKLLVPVMTALLMPGIIYESLKGLGKNMGRMMVASLMGLIALSPLFFYSVPQSLANLLLLILIFLTAKNLIQKEKNPVWYWLAVVAIFLIHPLAGIPALLVVAVERLRRIKWKWLYLSLASLLIPIFFMLASKLTDFPIRLAINGMDNLKELFGGVFSYVPFYSIYHLVYLYEYNWLILLILAVGTGGYYLIKKGEKNLLTNQLVLIGVLALNLVALSLFEFGSVIDYEQSEFIRRLGQIVVLAVLPIFLTGIYFILSKIDKLKGSGWLSPALIAGILSMSLYLAYPQVNAFEKNRGFSVSESDVSAVRLIEEDGRDISYVVLSNQSTSAASLQEFGFKSYVNNNLFYYPIPTSSPLYQIYLKLVYSGVKMEYINQAKELGGVERVYFVINDYWLDAKKRVEQAREIAENEIEVDGRIWVFEF